MAPVAGTPGWLRILLGIVLIIAGVVVLGNVVWFSLVGVMIIGIAAIVGGAFEVIHAFWTKGWGGFIWQVILGCSTSPPASTSSPSRSARFSP
jgi:uncharacterized membrane protein HdeD (DUF308 family)